MNHQRIALDAPVQKAGHQLLDHQCWAMGKDVLSTEGNLLCDFGFCQVRCPNGGMTQYELKDALGEGEHVYLWGFGAFFGSEREGIFLGRKDFKPRRTLGRIELHSKEYPNFTEETFRIELLLRGFTWFAMYEEWIATRMPAQYRDQCLAEFPRKAFCRDEFPARWRALASAVAEDLKCTWLLTFLPIPRVLPTRRANLTPTSPERPIRVQTAASVAQWTEVALATGADQAGRSSVPEKAGGGST